MKSSFTRLLLLSCIAWFCRSALAAPAVLIDPHCRLYFNGEATREDAIALSLNPNHAMAMTPREVQLRPGAMLDLMALGGKFALPEKNPSIVSGQLLATEDGICSLSIGGDWWYDVYINGELAFTTPDQGNGKSAAEDNYTFPAKVRKGENHFSVYLLSGRGAWLLAGPVVAREAAALDFRHQPYLTHASAGKVFVHFFATVPSVGYVDYREAGTEAWNRAIELQGGLSRNDRTRHRILLSGLKEDTLYEYRPVLTLRPETGEELAGPVRTFRSFTAAEKPFTLFYTSDTQMGMRTTRAQLEDYMTVCGGDQADLFVHGGDLDNSMDFEDEIFVESFPMVIGANRSQDIPLVLVRGNHEYRGSKTGALFDFFGSPEEKSYYGFRQGNTCFIVLDSGEDKPRIPDHWAYARTYDRPLMHEQRHWLEEYVTTDEFRTAKFHVVLCHSPGMGEKYMQESMAIVTDGIFTGEHPAHQLHLWVAGHTHTYIRSMTADSRSFRCSDPKRIFRARKTNFAYVVNDGPGYGGMDSTGMAMKFVPDRIEITCMERDGTIFDHFSIMPDGSVVEHFSTLDTVGDTSPAE